MCSWVDGEQIEHVRSSAGGVGGVVEGPVVAIHLTGENGAGLVGVAADGDHGGDILIEEFVEVLGVMR